MLILLIVHRSNSVGKDADGMVKKMAERYEEERERMRHSIDSLQKAHAMSVKQARASSESRDVLLAKTFAMKTESGELYDRAVKAEATVKELREAAKVAKEGEGAMRALKQAAAKFKADKDEAAKRAAEAEGEVDRLKGEVEEGQKEAKAAREGKDKFKVEAEAKSAALEKKVVALEGKVKGAAATLQTEVRQRAANKASGERSESQRAEYLCLLLLIC